MRIIDERTTCRKTFVLESAEDAESCMRALREKIQKENGVNSVGVNNNEFYFEARTEEKAVQFGAKVKLWIERL